MNETMKAETADLFEHTRQAFAGLPKDQFSLPDAMRKRMEEQQAMAERLKSPAAPEVGETAAPPAKPESDPGLGEGAPERSASREQPSAAGVQPEPPPQEETPAPRARKPYVHPLLELAEKGDVQGFMQEAERLSNLSLSADPELFWRGLRICLFKGGQKSMRDLSFSLALVSLGRTYECFERCWRQIRRDLDEADSRGNVGADGIPPHIATDWLPRLSRIQQELISQLRLLSQLRHVHAVAAREELKQQARSWGIDPLDGAGVRPGDEYPGPGGIPGWHTEDDARE